MGRPLPVKNQEHSTFIPLPLDQRIIEILSGAKSGAKISSAKKQ